ncbi:unnamed protein product [marine sediment metagenome]|uniref:Uncharacterized protein n=1 Tax=marine sediment metagenome TaxID=412755 RepID=X0VVK6_9ZZZZ
MNTNNFILIIITILIVFFIFNPKNFENFKAFKTIDYPIINQNTNNIITNDYDYYNIPEQDNKCKDNITNSYDCFLTKCDLCPMSSYKQCSNNYSYKTYPPNVSCNCDNRAYELCRNKTSPKCQMINQICNDWKEKELEDTIDYPYNFPRVNYYKTQNTKFTPYNYKPIQYYKENSFWDQTWLPGPKFL